MSLALAVLVQHLLAGFRKEIPEGDGTVGLYLEHMVGFVYVHELVCRRSADTPVVVR